MGWAGVQVQCEAEWRMSWTSRALPPVRVISARIFGNRVNPDGTKSGFKLLRRNRKGPALMSWYHRSDFRKEAYLEGNVPEKTMMKELRKERRRRRGKPPTKKGAGSKAVKKKKR